MLVVALLVLVARQGTTPGRPGDDAPVEEAPADETPADEAPADEAPVDEAPVDEAPVARRPRWRLPVPRRLAFVGLLVLVSCPLTLRSSWADWQYQSPVAELALVPLLAAAMAVVAAMRHPYLRTVRVGRADIWLGATLLALTAVVEGWALVQPGSYVWLMRFDALALPLVASAGVVLLLGVRAVVVLWPALAYLLLAWPLPVAAGVELTSGPVTRLTSSLVQAVFVVLPAAPSTVRQGTDLLVHVSGLRGDVDVAVTSACSGLNGMLGLLVVGIAVLYLYDGRLRGRAAWLAAGLALVLVLNVVRIVGLVVVAALLGPTVALDVLHPVVGIVMVNVALVAMMLLAGRFGLVRRPVRPAVSDNPLHVVGDAQPGRSRRLVVRAAGLVVVAALLGVLNLQMAQAAPAYRNSSLTSVQSLSAVLADASDVGYSTRSASEQRWARKYFGADSRWTRYTLESPDPAVPTVWADVLDTNSLSSLRVHSVMSCYRFHQQDVRSRKTVELSGGVLVETFVVEMDGGTWHVVSWQRPITRAGRVAHERITLMASSIEGAFAREFSAVGGSDGIRHRLVAGLNAIRPNEDPNPALSRSLLALADEVESRGTPARGAA
jgi:exosortase/archaeosortase family protein